MASKAIDTATGVKRSVVDHAKLGARQIVPVEREKALPAVEQEQVAVAAGLPDHVTVKGERFTVEVEVGEEGNTVYLVHPRWSVLGSGRTIEEAERDLRTEAREVGELLADDDPARFTRGGREMREFVLRFLDAPT